jgi:hypothetical protein
MILAAAVVSAVLIGLARGGRLRRLANLPLRWAWIALVAFGLQFYLIYFPEPVNEGIFSTRVVVLMFSYVLLFAVVWRNRALPGFWLIGLGFLSNFAVMLLNGGYMPITAESLAQVGHSRNILSPEPGARVRATKDIVLPREQTFAWWLSDIFVLPPPFLIPRVFSLGDVFIALGAFQLIQNGMSTDEKETRAVGGE